MSRTPLLLAALMLAPLPCRAQSDSVSGPSPSCDGEIVSEVVTTREPPVILSRSTFARPVVAAVLRHTTTRAPAILPFVQLHPGEPCSEFRRAESERVLRAQPYLADASVRAVPDTNGTVRIEITTVDEVSVMAGAGLRSTSLASLRYGSGNLMGNGMLGELEWRRGFAYREGFGVRFTDYHVLNGPNRLDVVAERFPLDAQYLLSLAHPFYTAFQHSAWFAGLRRSQGYEQFTRPSGPSLALSLDRRRYDVGGVARLGGGAARFFVGPLLTYERITPGANGVILSDSGFAADSDSTLSGRYATVSDTRLGAVVGFRALSFRTVYGFDALAGAQDVGSGLQVVSMLAQGFGSGRRGDLFGVDTYAGFATDASYLALHTTWESERQPRLGRWGDVVGSGRLAWYRKPSPRQTAIWSLEYAGALREQTPFQLTLGDHDGGVRGYHGSRAAGGERLVLRLERRWLLGGVTRFANVGVAAFSDAGKLWAAGVPYGQNTGPRVGAGVGLLLAIPKQSRRLVRADFALPLVPDHDARYEVRVSISTPFSMLWREPGAIARIRSAIPATNIFSWP